MSREYLIVAAVVLLGLLAFLWLSPGKPRSEDLKPMARNAITIIATDYAFAAPERLPAGSHTFELVNEGKELHHAALVKIAAGHTMDDLKAYLSQPPGAPMPDWLTEAGGPNGVIGSDKANATLDLQPGLYAWICFIPSPDGIPHFAKGMIRSLVVTPSNQPSVAVPVADLTMKLYDFGFEFPAEISAGRHLIQIENGGPQHHEVEFVKLLPGTTFEALVEWAKAEAGPPPAVQWLGGFAPASRGVLGLVTVDFQAGEYALLCFLPDVNDGKNHIIHGMAQRLLVK
jgi:hypothetical protein